ncbi:helix-turn-helix domain-containing protein [Paenibacillus sp. MSJ-34]|uniref:helix-turn-helix domain-containing protein n=1 Tax=Paenibacillus sp. MSJ-34 TaxID=2841529 RepID=UPI001C115784|nr:helix-turn-helix domain-containing protein [Paenibacillus sp. MSJ-34]MBU5443315.1 AraC family transcriptional regulator [Paenibacillus sp. MSJ-34]
MTPNFTPYIRVAYDSYIESDFYLSRAIYDYELIYLMEGELLVSVEEETYHCIPGDIIFLKPRQHHVLKAIGKAGIRQPHIHFDFYTQADSPDVKVSFSKLSNMTEEETSWFREDITETHRIALPAVTRLKNPILIERILFEMISEFSQKLPFHENVLQGLFLQLWGCLNREWNWQNNEQVQKYWNELQHVKAYLSHHCDKEVSLDELERITNISKYHLLRMFKLTYGITPIKYQLQSRIEKAKEFVQYTDHPLSEIAERFGFKTIHSFSRAFKNIEGVPPTYYRKKEK